MSLPRDISVTRYTRGRDGSSSSQALSIHLDSSLRQSWTCRMHSVQSDERWLLPQANVILTERSGILHPPLINANRRASGT